jgi:rubrerythrin
MATNVEPAKVSSQQVSDMIDKSHDYVCRDCGRGVIKHPVSDTGYQHRDHRPGEPDWHCPRTPLPPFGVLNAQR